jgi:hypothetical protein
LKFSSSNAPRRRFAAGMQGPVVALLWTKPVQLGLIIAKTNL